MSFTTQQKLDCAERELAIRLKVYSTRVAKGLMKEDVANHEINVMREIVYDYAMLAEKERRM